MCAWTRDGSTDEELAAWVRLVAVLELLPGVLDSQLRRDADLTHFEYFVLAMLSEAPDRTLRMTALARQTNAHPPPALPRRRPAGGPRARRALPLPGGRPGHQRPAHRAGWAKVRATAPGHVATVRRTSSTR